MARILHLDLTHGITSGSLLGALVDLGVAPSPLMHAVGAIPVGLSLRFENASGGVRAIAEPTPGEEPPRARRVDEVLALIDRAEVPERVLELARYAYRMLSDSKVGDDVPVYASEEDSVIHVVAAAHAVCELEPDLLTSSRIDLGGGDPDDAVVEILGDHVEVLTFDDPAEDATTPLGAATLAAMIGMTDIGLDEPEWREHPLEGRGLRGNGRALVARLGATAEP